MSDFADARQAPAVPRRIIDYVEHARAVFEAHRDKFGYLGAFPENACDQASQILARCLTDQFGVTPACVQGFGRPEKIDAAHKWITLDGAVIDVTHDQSQFRPNGLNQAQWVFPTSTAWHEAFTEKTVFPMLDRDQWQKGHHALYQLVMHGGEGIGTDRLVK